MESKLFNINEMSQLIGMSETEIKFKLGIPLDATCEVHTLSAATKLFHKAETQGAQLSALQRWVNLFLVEVEKAHIQRAVELYKTAPPDPRAELAVLKRIAYLLHFTDDYSYQILFNKAKNLFLAIELTLKNFNNLLGKSYIGPKKKLRICPHKGGIVSSREIYVEEIGLKKNKVLFIVYYGYNQKSKYEIFAPSGENIEKWSQEW